MERATFPDPAATFRDLKATLRDQRFFMHLSRWGRSMFQLKPIHGQIQTCLCQSKLLQLQQADVWQLRMGTWKSLGKTETLLG